MTLWGMFRLAGLLSVGFILGTASVHFGWPLRYAPPLVQAYEKPTLWPAGLARGRSGWAVAIEYGDYQQMLRVVERACRALHQPTECSLRGYQLEVPPVMEVPLPREWPRPPLRQK